MSILTGNVQRPNGITWFNNKLYTACTGDSTVYELDSTTGTTATYIFGLNNAHTLHAEEDEGGQLHLWAPDFVTNELVHITRNGVQPVAEGLQGPWGILPMNESEFLISNLLGNNITRVTRDGSVEEVVNNLLAPTGLAMDGSNIYVGNNGSTRRAIEWFTTDDLAGGMPVATQPLVTGLQNTTGLAMGADNKLYFAYALGTRGVVGRVDPAECIRNGGCTSEQVEIVVLTELAAPLAGLSISPDMRLFVHTMFRPDIYWVQLEGARVADANTPTG
jgi:hypothetical protein